MHLTSSFHQQTTSKIFRSPAELRAKLDEYNPHDDVILVKGVYDLLHSGHYYSFVNAKTYGNILVVAVSSDRAAKQRKGQTRPIINEEERMLMVASLACVDYVTLYDQTSPYSLLKTLLPHVFVASHFESLEPKHKKELEKIIQFVIVPKLGGNSTSQIIQKILGE